MSTKTKGLTKQELKKYEGFEELDEPALESALEFIHLMSEVVIDILEKESLCM